MALITLFPTNDSKWLYLNWVTSLCTSAALLPLSNCGGSSWTIVTTTGTTATVIITWPSYLSFHSKANSSAAFYCAKLLTCSLIILTVSLFLQHFLLIGRQCVQFNIDVLFDEYWPIEERERKRPLVNVKECSVGWQIVPINLLNRRTRLGGNVEIDGKSTKLLFLLFLELTCVLSLLSDGHYRASITALKQTVHFCYATY